MSHSKSTSFKWFIFKRALGTIPLLFGVIVIAFILTRIGPGDVTMYIAGDTYVPKEILDQIRSSLGLDLPLTEQFIIYFKQVIQGNLGYSFISRKPVLDLILEHLPRTLTLVLIPMSLSSIIGTILGVVAAQKKNSSFDNTTSLISLIGFSIPQFWFAQLLLLVFAVYLGWFPVYGSLNLKANYSGFMRFLDVIHHLILPSIALGLGQLALITRLTRSSMIEALNQDYIIWARSKGLNENVITFKHALRNALIPVVTLVGYNFGFILTGSLYIETIFAWSGLGRLMLLSILARDFPVITGQLIFVSIMVIMVNLVTDIIYGLLDPRIRY